MTMFPTHDQDADPLTEILAAWRHYQDVKAAGAPLAVLGTALDELHRARMRVVQRRR